MSMGKRVWITGNVYHVYSKSIAGFKIFNSEEDFTRVIEGLQYYQRAGILPSFSYYKEMPELSGVQHEKYFNRRARHRLVDIVAYCIMPTHIHFILKQLQPFGVTLVMKKLLNSYTKYFNMRHRRKGPLWEGRFKAVLVKTDEQLLHLTRYIHLNPVTAELVDNPEDWAFSSCREYLALTQEKMCNYEGLFTIEPDSYREFLLNRIDYQKELASIKSLLLD
ncbi:MAG: transposase [Candidatus Omnitrophica bacterium]|nr:transposase [Candidatus Omnitrophota bacterium]